MKNYIFMVALAMVMLSSSAMADVCVWGTDCNGGAGNTGPLGISGDRIYTTYVDDNLTTVAQGVLMFGSDAGSGGQPISNTHLRNDSGNLSNSNSTIFSISGGRLKATAISVRANQVLSGAPTNQQCDYTIYKTDTATLAVWDTSKLIADAGWTACTGIAETGTLSDNCGLGAGTEGTCDGAAGVGDNVVDDIGEYATIPLSDCECAATDCKMILIARDRVATTEECEINADTWVSVFIEEVYP